MSIQEILPTDPSQYRSLLLGLWKESEESRISKLRWMCQHDLWFLLTEILNRKDMTEFGEKTSWLFQRTREIQFQPDGYLDLWAREHYKTTIITFGLTIQDLLNDPELMVGIFSHTRPAAKSFLRQIKREFESNEILKVLFPDVLWARPETEAPKWTEDDGIILKRKGNPKEATIEAWGIVDGQPIGKHFPLMVYDDVVTRETVGSAEMMKKATEMLELSYSLGTEAGKRRFVGTRYHMRDSYQTIIERGTAKPRIYRATVDGRDEGEPVLWTKERLAKRRADQGMYTFASQMQQNPFADKAQGFRRQWIKWHEDYDGVDGNKYIIVDPANAKKKESDWTAIGVIELGADRNYYLIDAVYDRLNLTERTDELFRLHKKWLPQGVGYEKYGMMADIEHIKFVQEAKKYRFGITELSGSQPKPDRIRRLIPIFEQGRIYMPQQIIRKLYDGRTVDIIEKILVEEYDAFPIGLHDDFLDMFSRILDAEMFVLWPMQEEKDKKPDRYKPKRRDGSAWAA